MTWINALESLSRPIKNYGMGRLSLESEDAKRTITFRYRLVPEKDGIEWSLWDTSDDEKPECVMSFRESTIIIENRMKIVLSVMKMWLSNATLSEIKEVIKE